MISTKDKITLKSNEEFANQLEEYIDPAKEKVVASFMHKKQGAVFTDKRLIITVFEGFGKKKNISVIPYESINCLSFSTKSNYEKDASLEINVQGLGLDSLKIEIIGHSNIKEVIKYL